MNQDHNQRAQAFLAAIKQVCVEHGLSLAHEDEHGCFYVKQLNEFYFEWLNHTVVELDERPGE